MGRIPPGPPWSHPPPSWVKTHRPRPWRAASIWSDLIRWNVMDDSYLSRTEKNSAQNPSPIQPTLSRDKRIKQSGSACTECVSCDAGACASERRGMRVRPSTPSSNGLLWDGDECYGARRCVVVIGPFTGAHARLELRASPSSGSMAVP
jgi:hypothetical protein